MNEEELKRDILFQIDMQLYDKYNKIIAGMNDHLGDIYTYRDIEEVEKAEREEKIDLLTKAIIKLQKEIEELIVKNKKLQDKCKELIFEKQELTSALLDSIPEDKIEEKMRGEINKSWRNTEQRKCQLYAYDILKELLGE